MHICISGQGELHLYEGQNIEEVDLRSAGYFHITRDGIQRCLHESFIFLNEKESQYYLSLMLTDNDKTPQKNTRLDIRKTPIDGTEKSPRFKDNTKKDLYPLLDDNNPRGHMTDKEILKSTVDLSEACSTEGQKQALYKILLKYREAFSLGIKLDYVQMWK